MNHFHSCGLWLAFSLAATLPGAVRADEAGTSDTLETVVITAERLNEKRAGIETQTGASAYTIDQAAIAATPGGDNTLLNQVILQAPDVVQDSFGQFHVRGDHNDLQYRLNGIILPEGISVFGQSLSPRLIASLKLVTGALPAEYGLRTAGIVDLTTKSGALQPGGEISLYGGSHGTFEPSFDYGGSDGNLNYFVSGDYQRNALGIESPDGSSTPLHDHTTQYHGFGYFEDILDPDNRVSLILGTSNGKFQIPNQSGLQPSLGLTVDGQTQYPSDALDENQRELTSYGILSWQHAGDALDWQSSINSRYSSLTFTPDVLGDLLYNGIAQQAYKRDVAFGWQTDLSYKLGASHTLRAGWYLQHDQATSLTSSEVLTTNDSGEQTSDAPVSIVDDGSQTQWIESLYLQDEWQVAAPLTLNYGLRFDHYHAYASGSQVSPRLNAVWTATPDTTVHAGYSRYFTPPPFELVGGETLSKFVDTTAAPSVLLDDVPLAERSNYYDLGVEQQLGQGLTAGVDGYYRRSSHLIDEGQFGAPIILTPFNYRDGRIKGIEFTTNYASDVLSLYANLALQSAQGRGIESAQFNFDPDDLDYIATNYIHLDHEQRVTGSAGASWLLNGTRLSLDMLAGTGLRADLVRADGSSVPNGAHVPGFAQFNLGASHAFHFGRAGDLTARVDLINVLDRRYEIRDGTGVGVGAPQFGPRRGIFFGVSRPL
ncbi:MAG TPA: TonB-dependent receptor [Steroidobacteraceae bacterium]|nr:TonB-dependent receptor [Steroidobacteraceae bacterium]